MEKQDAEDESPFECPERDRNPVLDHLQWPENPKLHGVLVSRFAAGAKRRSGVKAGPNEILIGL
jgi:hypothetical protein